MGTVNFYRQFIPNFAEHAGPLTDLLRKGCPNKLVWSPELRENFTALKAALMKGPILKLPDLTKASQDPRQSGWSRSCPIAGSGRTADASILCQSEAVR